MKNVLIACVIALASCFFGVGAGTSVAQGYDSTPAKSIATRTPDLEEHWYVLLFYNSKKPTPEDQARREEFRVLEQKYDDQAVFVEIDIAKPNWRDRVPRLAYDHLAIGYRAPVILPHFEVAKIVIDGNSGSRNMSGRWYWESMEQLYVKERAGDQD